MKIIMHSYTFRTWPLEEAFANAQRFGWEGIELQPCHFDREKIETELPAAIALGKKYGIEIACVDFGGDFMSGDTQVVEAAVAQMEKEIEACAANGVSLMNGGVGPLVKEGNDWGENGSALATDEHYRRAAEAMRYLGEKAAAHDITITFEIHMNTLHDTIASTAALLDRIGLDNVMANPDCGNMFGTSTAEDDPEALDLLQGRIGYFHFKNCEKTGDGFNYSIRLADGHIDISKWVAKLCAMNYDGPICIEYCGAGDPHVAAEADLGYFRKTLGWIRGGK